MHLFKPLWPYIVVAAIGTTVLLFSGFTPSSPDTQSSRRAVLVELFTSEGCSSCPPADELLARLQQQPMKDIEIVPLGFHVDYWNQLGWKDRFSSADYSRRQQEYSDKLRTNGPYTPQMVVDGQTEFVGSIAGTAQSAITRAASQPTGGDIQLTFEQDKLRVRAQAADTKAHGQLFLAITEDNLVTQVAAGENNGHALHHSAVVREFKKVGELKNGRFESDLSVSLKPDWKRQDLHLVVFMQDPSKGKVLAITTARLPKA